MSMVVTLSAPVLLVAGLATAVAVLAAPIEARPDTSVDIVVKNWSFTPATIEAHVGEAKVLRFSDSEGVHGVESAELGLAKTIITPGKVTEVTFTPKTSGTYPVHCAVICGEGHDKMLLTVKVLP